MTLKEKTILKGSISSYEVKKLIDHGGMSTVWLAEDIYEDYTVAIKLAKNWEIAINKIIFERNIMKNLSHIHLVNYYDTGFYKNLPFIVMEYANGINLEKLAAGKPLDEKEAKARAIQLLLAVDYLHSMNIIHRDIKPKNIILGNANYLKLLDLGTAAFYNSTGIKEAVISPGGYTPPEQYRFTYSIQGDIWSVAATLFYMVTGQHPIILMPGYPNNISLSPPDPRKLNRDLSENFANIIMKGMAWEPLNRYSTAKEMIEAIEKRTHKPRKGPRIEIFGQEIVIDAPKLIFGRAVAPAETSTMKKQIREERIRIFKEGDVIKVNILDPFNWISRKHFEIFEKNGKWYFRDLGSLNRSAVLTKGELKEIWVGYKRESPPYELGSKAIIYLAYGSSLKNPPYITLTFKKD